MKMGAMGKIKVIKEAINTNHRGRSYMIRVIKVGQIANAEHKAHIQHLNNYKAVPLGTDKERNWTIRRHFHEGNARRT